MRMRPVTDPDILAELEGGAASPQMSSGGSPRPVTDPDMLKELNGGEGGDFNPSFLDKLAPNILAGLANVGHGVLNAPYNISKFLEGKSKGQDTLASRMGLTSDNIPHLPDYDYSAMLKLPGTTGDKIVQGVTEAVPSLLMPEARLGDAGALISKIPKVGGYLKGAAGRMLPQVGYSAATSPDIGQGAENAAIGQAVGEVLPLGLKGVAKVSEFMNPKGFAKKLGDMFSEDYARARAKAGSYYRQVTDKIGGKDIYTPPAPTGQPLLQQAGAQAGGASIPGQTYRDLDQDVINRYFTPKVKKLHQDFMDDPTLTNAHRLQKQLGATAAQFQRMAAKDPMAGTVADSMNYAYGILDKDIKGFIGQSSPDLANKWQKGIDIFREEAAPYRVNTPLHDMASGKRQTITPAQAQGLLTRSVEKGQIPEGHYITKALADLNRKVERGKSISSLVPPIVKNLSPLPGMLDFASNPWVQGTAQKLSPYYERIKNAIIASQAQGSNK